jgi:hypothetical protein
METTKSAGPSSDTSQLPAAQGKEPKENQLVAEGVGTQKAEGTMSFSDANPKDGSKQECINEAPAESTLPDLWQKAIDSLDEKDQGRLQNCQAEQSSALSITACPTIVDSILEKARSMQQEDKEQKWKSVSSFLSRSMIQLNDKL